MNSFNQARTSSNFIYFNAARGDYGPGDAEAQAMSRIERVRERKPHELKYELADGRILNIRYSPTVNGGLVLSYDDISERKRAQETILQSEVGEQLSVCTDERRR